MSSNVEEEILALASQWCEEQLDDAGVRRLEELLRGDPAAADCFVEYVQLHGQLHWEAGGCSVPATQPVAQPSATQPSATQPVQLTSVRSVPAASPRRHLAVLVPLVTVAALLLMVFVLRRDAEPGPPVVAENGQQNPDGVDGGNASGDAGTDGGSGELPPLRLDNLDPHRGAREVASGDVPDAGDSDVPQRSRQDMTDAAIVARIDNLLRRSWQENEVTPVAVASDAEWIRRVSLALTGRIPSLAQVNAFLADKSPRKRTTMLQQMLHDDRLSESFAVIWTNLLVGRSTSRDIDADALFTFLHDQFRDNRPWIETVGRLLAAEGRNDEVGETNFLLAHLNNQATPATAVVSRLFLCEQVHCMQCHDHPTAQHREQEEFWELNAFFKQTKRKSLSVPTEDGKQKRVWSLSDAESGGMTFFEDRRGQQVAVLPEFDGHTLTAAPTERRRSALTEFLELDSRQRVARAMVNRMWAHFFGAGFTNPVDDMGPHNPPTHPELLDALTEAFVASDYDLRRLMKWIASTEAWQLSSWPPVENVDLDPLKGGTPVFSQVYPRHMSPEEVYESIRVAIRSIGRQPLDSSVRSQHRRQWVGQFVRALENDENEETLSFEGDVSQALLMMNGEDTEQSLPPTIASLLSAPDGPGYAAGEALNQVSMATVSRAPTESEERVFRNRYRDLSRSMPREHALAIALEDMLWGYLNCSEFVTVQ